MQENDFAKAFYHKDDLMYDELKVIFGKELDMSNEVISISCDGDSIIKPNSLHFPRKK